uniref:SRCR domain-containing protein n=1 Tax=Seriola lalandi dorsalis TaxID=1841481 RepID=A0A3B4YCY5_SERLL
KAFDFVRWQYLFLVLELFGRLEVKSNQSNQLWSSVCEADFDQQDAEVVCRELGCGAPSVLQGALYGEVEAPMWTRQFQCGGNESSLLDCRSSDSARTTCSLKSVGLTCSGRSGAAPVRLVGGASRCAGTLQVNRGEWRPVDNDGWTLKGAAVACRELNCGFAVSTRRREESSYSSVWRINTDCVHSGFMLKECLSSASSSSTVELTCSGKHVIIIFLYGINPTGGRICVHMLNRLWDMICNIPVTTGNLIQNLRRMILQGALYGEVEAPMWTREFQCGGNESSLLDCRSSDSLSLSLSADSVRLVNGTSLCSGRLEVKSNQFNQSNQWWSSVCDADFDQQDAEVVCRELGCGAPSVLQGALYGEVEAPMWTREFQCGGNESALRDCRTPGCGARCIFPALDWSCSQPRCV